jgi:hypothetical protein
MSAHIRPLNADQSTRFFVNMPENGRKLTPNQSLTIRDARDENEARRSAACAGPQRTSENVSLRRLQNYNAPIRMLSDSLDLRCGLARERPGGSIWPGRFTLLVLRCSPDRCRRRVKVGRASLNFIHRATSALDGPRDPARPSESSEMTPAL